VCVYRKVIMEEIVNMQFLLFISVQTELGSFSILKPEQ